MAPPTTLSTIFLTPTPHHLSSFSQVVLDVPQEIVCTIIIQSDHVAAPVHLNAHGWPHPLHRRHKVLSLVRITIGREDHEIIEGDRSDEDFATHVTRPVCLLRPVVQLQKQTKIRYSHTFYPTMELKVFVWHTTFSNESRAHINHLPWSPSGGWLRVAKLWPCSSPTGPQSQYSIHPIQQHFSSR